MVDPQQRLLLEATAELVRSRPAAELAGAGQLGEAGVFVGISTPDYGDIKKVREGWATAGLLLAQNGSGAWSMRTLASFLQASATAMLHSLSRLGAPVMRSPQRPQQQAGCCVQLAGP